MASLLDEVSDHLRELDRGFTALKTSVARRRAACAREHAAAAKRAGASGDERTKWTGPVIEPWLAGRTPGDTGLGGAARRNRRGQPGADENPAPRGGT